MSQKCIQNSDMVERVAAAIGAEFDKDDLPPGGWSQLNRDAAKAALEACHHAELVAENLRLRTALRQIHDLTEGLLNDIEAEEALA